MDTNVSGRPVVVGYDSFGTGDAAFDWAVREAARLQAPLHLLVARGIVYLAAPGFGAASPWPDDLTGQMVSEARSYAAQRAPGTKVTVDSSVGTSAAFLVDASREAALVVVGRRVHSAVREAFSGSTSAQVVAHAACPVVVVDRELELPATAPIVVAVDGSSANDSAIAFAFDRAAALGASVVAVHAWWVDAAERIGVAWLTEEQIVELEHAEQRLLDDAISPWADKYPEVPVRKVLVRQVPVAAVLAEATGAQLIVTGSRGHGGFVGLLVGSVSQGLLHSADRPCPLVVVHTEDRSLGPVQGQDPVR